MGRIRRTAVITLAVLGGIMIGGIAIASFAYGPEYVTRVLVMRESSQADYLENFPLRLLSASSNPYEFATDPQEAEIETALATVLAVDDLQSFLTEAGTQALIVIQDDKILYERYFNEAARDSMLTSFSVAKSFDSALVGIAIDEGFIGGVDDPITSYLPELRERDRGFEEITIRHLLRMASGLAYEEMRLGLFNGDDPLTTYFPDQREIALENTTIVDTPGKHFSYNKYHPQLLGMVLERTTGMSVTEYTQTRLWDPLGMQYDGAWALDSTESGFEKMEAGLNARAIDFAKLGRLYLNEGSWDGTQVVSAAWVEESLSADPTSSGASYYRDDFGQWVYSDGTGWYGYMWYGKTRPGQQPDFFAEGDHGQFIYVSPSRNLIVVRNGTDFGIAGSAWVQAFYDLASGL